MALRIALSGFVVLVVAMGIGRFAFTPQVPLMIAAGQLTLTSAGLVAAMNYLGYLVGAWDAMRAHRFVETRLWLGITGAVALTLLSAAAENAVVHGLLRFVIGCMSGWSMVLIAAWTNERLGQLGKPGLSAAVFAGPGAGIALSGLLAVYIQAKSLSAGAAWQIYGVLALVLIVLVARYLPRAGQLHRPDTAPEPLLWSGATAWPGLAISSRRPFYRKWRRCVFPAACLPSLSGQYLAPPRWWGLRSALPCGIHQALTAGWRLFFGYRGLACWRPGCCRA